MEKLQYAARGLGIRLTSGQLALFQAYHDLLIDWNRRINLTAITGYEEVQVKHFLDSLTVLPVLGPVPSGYSVIDIGSGAGLPGLPLKIACPQIHLVLLEATAKKADFLRDICVKLGLTDVEVVAERAEEAARNVRYREQFDLALSRAVAALATLAELALPFCRVGGCLIALKKGDIAREVSLAGKAVERLGGSLREIVPVRLDEFRDGRCLVVIEKVASTPAGYPRRAGIPGKRPLL